eukprot:TRINITY_DN7034_c0_g1_i1.p1 TRINITY_DN7034_c0_g1~~TRINITY_DN7034_c0_g1_i1.p1  ORF type:complete len:426 (+),score=73.63 TRINITY_DN7034_c0_g1_i1:87-1280(+)
MAPTPNHAKEERDTITWTAFDSYETDSGESRQCLILAYTNGFQIWDIENTQNIHEIISKRDGAIKSLKFLPKPINEEREQDPLYRKRPILAVARSHEHKVNLFNLSANDFTNALNFNSEIYSIMCTKRLLVVALKDHLFAFNSVTMQREMAISTHPCPFNIGVVALGSRWLAYPANIPAPSSKNQHSTSDKIVEAAKDMATNLYYFGQKTITEYMYPGAENQPKIQDSMDQEVSGTIIVFDTIFKKPLAHFKAHKQPISTLCFDPSGTLLVTASTGGTYLNVFQITPHSPNGTHRHLYKLQRGVTSTTIQGVTFSEDSRWMAASSIRGTTHIYAINPTGGNVNIHTHLRTANKVHWTHESNTYTSLSSLNRIKTIYQSRRDCDDFVECDICGISICD